MTLSNLEKASLVREIVSLLNWLDKEEKKSILEVVAQKIGLEK